MCLMTHPKIFNSIINGGIHWLGIYVTKGSESYKKYTTDELSAEIWFNCMIRFDLSDLEARCYEVLHERPESLFGCEIRF